ncbi:Decaprenyl diphosphate synthase-like protein [Aspergillus sergii]|uniref:ditrans,polycis-polyprenyl diphosphate synthase [(2E,6E)-farnesyldiphosphate specific] n=1 Tax=Aspergillus sergii TaxID=1034303 RepID=A0A5N6X717_9EURO|nr:Decaprenyl diphosphate synthase-like protein [Aspergillus sergii]
MISQTLGYALNQAVDHLFLSYDLVLRFLYASPKVAYLKKGDQSYHRFQVEKLPSHLAVILSSEENVVEDVEKKDKTARDLASITKWCTDLKIKNVSIYTRQELPQDLQQATLRLVASDNAPSETSPPEDREFSSNIRFLNYEDRNAVLERVISHCGDEGTKVAHENLSEKVSKVLENMYGPPPELVIVFSSRFCLDGYPPWHLKYAEMHHFPDIPEIRQLHLRTALQRFARAEMRHGK